MEELPPFDPKSKCTKCGWSIPDPVAPPPKVIAGGAVATPAQKPGEETAAISADFVYNLPAELALPTLYEIRRLDQPDWRAMAAAAETKAPAAKPTAEKKPAPEKPTGILHQPPPPPPQPPTVFYCNGLECPWELGNEVEEHLHQFCDVCNYEWLAKPLDAT